MLNHAGLWSYLSDSSNLCTVKEDTFITTVQIGLAKSGAI